MCGIIRCCEVLIHLRVFKREKNGFQRTDQAKDIQSSVRDARNEKLHLVYALIFNMSDYTE